MNLFLSYDGFQLASYTASSEFVYVCRNFFYKFLCCIGDHHANPIIFKCLNLLFFLSLKRSHICRVSGFHSYFWYGS